MQGFKSFAKRTEIIFDKGINVIIGPNGSGKSVDYNTIVTLSDGTERMIGELVEEQIGKSKEIKKLDDGIYVDFVKEGNEIEIISLNKDTMKSEQKRVSKFIRREGDTLFKIRTRSGRELKATGCHPIMTYSNGKIESRKINEMDKGFFVAVPRKIKLDSNIDDVEFSRLMGYIIGDGYIANDRIEFINKDLEVLEDFENLILKHSKWGIRKRVSGENVRVYSRDKELYSRIRELYRNNKKKTITSENKIIPNYFLKLGKKSVSNLLAGLFDTDGSVRKDLGVIEFCTKNKELARQVQSVLLRFDILSKVKKRTSCAKNTEFKREGEYYYLYIYGQGNIRKFYDNIPLRIEYKKKNLKSILSKEKISNPNVDLLPKEVNDDIKKLVNLLGIKVKKERKKYPSLAAYVENRCSPSREKVSKCLILFNERFSILVSKFGNLELNQEQLVKFMDLMNISSRKVSESVGLHKTIIRNQWASGLSEAREENLIKFKNYLKQVYVSRVAEIGRIINLLTNLCNSDVCWDEIVSIDRLEKPEWVYDLTIEGNHNFIANNIFAHNSNISDAMCFVLGRLSIKSMRAAKARNLIFMGSKYVKPAGEASVELVFDNTDRAFNINTDEISLKRIVRRNGQGMYKINNETKTRGEIIELLAHAGIDPHGFNMVLQGQIQSIVKMHPEDRRKIIEEVAGIAIYESRKEKSLKELEKTEERLKEIGTILRERTSYLNNLEKEKRQAERFRELETTAKRAKATIISKKLEGKKREVEGIMRGIREKEEQKDKIRTKVREIEGRTDSLSGKIEEINSNIKQATGLEQEKLHDEIANLRAEIEGLRVRKENYENKKEEIERRIEELGQDLPDLEQEISELRRESPLMAKKAEELKKKKVELSEIEEKRKRLHGIKKEVEGLRERIKDKERQKAKIQGESEELINELESLSGNLKYKSGEDVKTELERLFKNLKDRENLLEELNRKEIENERIIGVSEIEIKRAKESKKNVSEIDICPLCQSKLTKDHVEHVFMDSERRIGKYAKEGEEANKKLEEIKIKRGETRKEVVELSEKTRKCEREMNVHTAIMEKKFRLKTEVSEQNELEAEIKGLEERLKGLEGRGEDIGRIEESYDRKISEIEEISSRTEEDVDTVLLYKERELENMKNIIKRSSADSKDVAGQVEEISSNLENKEKELEDRENKEEELNKRFKELFAERDKIQKEIQESNLELSERQGDVRQVEEQVNYLKIGKAKLDAEAESLEMELSEFRGVELLQGSIPMLEEKLQKAHNTLATIGNINMRALEVYEQVKEEYEKVRVKVETLDKEKIEIMKIIEEIDKKKKKTFMKTFSAINDLFTSNFNKLSKKGVSYLEIENKENIFAGGLNIVVKLSRGKSFDVTSLSGGEQTLVALSLLFAVQEYKPYHFYIFDEIDAALDKRNSERLAGLLNQYMKSGQYIVITHNDAIMLENNLFYGVSMHEGVSKIFSLKVEEN